MTKTQETIDLVKQWWNSLTPIKQNNNLPAKGTVAGALVVLETLKVKYVLDIDQHRAKGQSQIKGVGKARVQKILAEFGEMRDFLKEGGRTNRGLAGDVAKLLDALSSAALEPLPPDTRNGILTEVQGFLVGKVSEYFSQERVKIIYDPSTTAWQSIHDILESAKEVGKEGPVAQYLVGAKLALRFPSFNIRNDTQCATLCESDSHQSIQVKRSASQLKIQEHANRMGQHLADQAVLEMPHIVNSDACNGKAFRQV